MPDSLISRFLAPSESRDSWLLIGVGILLAGAAYGVFLACIYGTVILYAMGFAFLQQPSLEVSSQLFAVLPAILIFFAAACAAGSVGAIWAGFLSAVIVPLFYLFARSLRLRTSLEWLGAICGGLVGFVAVMPVWLNLRLGDGFDPALLVLTVLGPGLTTVFGQLGGAWGGRSAMRNREATVEYHLTSAENGEPRLRFQIRHLLWVTVWLALLLTAIRLSGIPFELILPVLIAWLIYQAVTLYCGWLFFARLRPWWSQRSAGRST